MLEKGRAVTCGVSCHVPVYLQGGAWVCAKQRSPVSHLGVPAPGREEAGA